MKTLRSVAVGLALSWLMSGWAFAGTSTITTKDASGTTKTFDVITDGTGNFGAMIGVCDGTALAQCAAVKAASTAALATDPSLVVRINPGDAVATGIASIVTNTAAAIPDCGATPCTNKIGVVGVNTWAGTALGAVANFGTTPTAVAVPGVNASLFVGTTVADGNSGNKSAGTQRVVLATDQPSLTNALSVINGATSAVNTIAASQSAQVLSNTSGGGTGATGDYLSHCVVIPTSTSPGVVTILDNATSVFPFPGGATSLSNLAPFTIPVGSKSVSGGWKVTTGANVSVSCVGKFS